MKQSVELRKLARVQDRERGAQCLATGAGNVGKQPAACVAEQTFDHASVVRPVASYGKTPSLKTVDDLGSRGIGDAQHAGEMADRYRPGLGQHEEQAKLPESEVVLGPERRFLSGNLEQRLDVGYGLIQCYERR